MSVVEAGAWSNDEAHQAFVCSVAADRLHLKGVYQKDFTTGCKYRLASDGTVVKIKPITGPIPPGMSVAVITHGPDLALEACRTIGVRLHLEGSDQDDFLLGCSLRIAREQYRKQQTRQ